jgi:hypothetical protein
VFNFATMLGSMITCPMYIATGSHLGTWPLHAADVDQLDVFRRRPDLDRS